MTMSIVNRPTAKDRDSKAMLGADKHLGGVTSIALNGVSLTPTELKALLQKDIDSANTVDTARATWQKTVKDARSTRSQTAALLRALRGYLIATHGVDAVDLLADFGFVPPKSKKADTKTKAAAVDKTIATRSARHTMGKKQRQQVKGTTAPPEAGKAASPQASGGGKPSAS
jgi:hypothetical protein